MLTIDTLDDNTLKIFVLKETLDDMDMDVYYIDYFCATDIKDDIISMVVNFKSKESAKEYTEINGYPISMDFVVIKNFEIEMKEYNKYLRNKKLSKLKDGIL